MTLVHVQRRAALIGVFKVGVGSAELAIGHFGHAVHERLRAQIKLVWLRYCQLVGSLASIRR